DTFVFADSFGDDNQIIGGDGNDTLDLSATTTQVVVDLSEGTAAQTSTSNAMVLSSIETVIAGSGDDFLTGSVENERLEGGSGSDTHSGGLGDDTLMGGLDNDRYQSFNGNFGADIIDDAGGTDTLSLSNYNLADATIQGLSTDDDDNIDALVLDFGNG